MASYALRGIIALVAAGSSFVYFSYGFILYLMTGASSETGTTGTVIPFILAAVGFMLALAAMMVFVSAAATVILMSLLVAIWIGLFTVAVVNDPADVPSMGENLLFIAPPVLVLVLSIWLVSMGCGTRRGSMESRLSPPLVGAACIGCAFGVYQSIVMVSLVYMVCTAASIAMLKWPRFAWWLAGSVVLVAVLHHVGVGDDSPRLVDTFSTFSLPWLIATAAMLPLVYLGTRAVNPRSPSSAQETRRH